MSRPPLDPNPERQIEYLITIGHFEHAAREIETRIQKSDDLNEVKRLHAMAIDVQICVNHRLLRALTLGDGK